MNPRPEPMAVGTLCSGEVLPPAGDPRTVLPLTPTCCPSLSYRQLEEELRTMDQALKSLMAFRGGGSHLSGPFWPMAPSLSSPSPPPRAALSQLPVGRGLGASSLRLSLTTLLFSSPPPCSHCATSTVSPLCPHILPCHTPPAVNVYNLEGELKIVTNNLKSLEAQADKVEGAEGQ